MNTPQPTSNLFELLKLREEYKEYLHFQLNESPDQDTKPNTFKEWFLTVWHYEIQDNGETFEYLSI